MNIVVVTEEGVRPCYTFFSRKIRTFFTFLGMICGRKYRRERPRFYKGGTEEDPLNLNNVGIDPEQELKEMEKEANQIQVVFSII